MMTWQGFPLPLLKRSSNKLEAARGRPRLAPAIARQASRPINPPHPVSQWKQTSFGASSAIPALTLPLLTTKPAADMQHPWDLQTAEGPGHWAPVQSRGLRDICDLCSGCSGDTEHWAGLARQRYLPLYTPVTTGHQWSPRGVMDMNRADQWQHLQCWQNISHPMSWLRNVPKV